MVRLGVGPIGLATYSPPDNFCGTDQFVYEICINDCCSQATVSVEYTDDTDPSISGDFSTVTVECDNIPSISLPTSLNDNCDEAPDLTFDETYAEPVVRIIIRSHVLGL